MNLNSYIGLLGKKVTEIEDEHGCRIERPPRRLRPTDPGREVRAHSGCGQHPLCRITRRASCWRWKPGGTNGWPCQTPYSAVRSAPGTLERIAGATTDIHRSSGLHAARCHLLGGGQCPPAQGCARRHRGHHDRERASGKRYIQDRTVIEDTESSVDLIARGWRLVNYPERLSYSATPPDFGALVIQRRRWANGGLIILP